VEIDRERIGVDDLDIGRHAASESVDEALVLFDGNDSARGFGQGGRQYAAPGADLNDDLLGLGIDDPDDLMQDGWASQEVLSEGMPP
jgi:hypothetical protein